MQLEFKPSVQYVRGPCDPPWLPGSRHGWREAESAYTFSRGSDGSIRLQPRLKRWIEERSPPELFNHGFENMESLGAVYSRVSSMVFGDWNQCGKVMGLAPWFGRPASPPETIPLHFDILEY